MDNFSKVYLTMNYYQIELNLKTSMIFFMPILALGIILMVLFFSYDNGSEKVKVFVNRSDDLQIPITFKQLNKNVTKNEITLRVPAILTLKEYFYTDTTENKVTNSTFLITYEDLTQTRTIQTDNLVGVSFDAKTGTIVQYDLKQDIALELNEALINVFIFNTKNLKSKLSIELIVNNEKFLYEIIVND